MTAPTRRPFSLLQRAISCASSMNLSSQALENIADQVLRSALSLKHVSAKRPAVPAPPPGNAGVSPASKNERAGEMPAPRGGEDGDWPGNPEYQTSVPNYFFSHMR